MLSASSGPDCFGWTPDGTLFSCSGIASTCLGTRRVMAFRSKLRAGHSSSPSRPWSTGGARSSAASPVLSKRDRDEPAAGPCRGLEKLDEPGRVQRPSVTAKPQPPLGLTTEITFVRLRPPGTLTAGRFPSAPQVVPASPSSCTPVSSSNRSVDCPRRASRTISREVLGHPSYAFGLIPLERAPDRLLRRQPQPVQELADGALVQDDPEELANHLFHEAQRPQG